jgi:hypothetical protein
MTTSAIESCSSVAEISTRGGRSISLVVLHWIEYRYVSVAFKALGQHVGSAEDAWWISVGSEVQGPIRFVEVLKAVLDESLPINVVHHSRISEDPTPWQTILYQPWWSNNLIGKMWTIAFWCFWALGGWVLVEVATPQTWHTGVDIGYWFLIACLIVKRKALLAWFGLIGTRLTHGRFRSSYRESRMTRDNEEDATPPEHCADQYGWEKSDREES